MVKALISAEGKGGDAKERQGILKEALEGRGWSVIVSDESILPSRWLVATVDVWLAMVDDATARDSVKAEQIAQMLRDLDSWGIFGVVVGLGFEDLSAVPKGQVVKYDATDVDGVVERLVAAREDYEATVTDIIKYRRERKRELIGASDEYIDKTLEGLGRRSLFFLISGVVCHVAAAAALLGGAILGYVRLESLPAGAIESGAVFKLVASFVGAIGLLLALSAYTASLGKFFVHESIVISNRRHAIRYGRFFLLAYGDQISRQEVAEVLRDWNMVSLTTAITGERESIDLVSALVEGLKSLGKKTD